MIHIMKKMILNMKKEQANSILVSFINQDGLKQNNRNRMYYHRWPIELHYHLLAWLGITWILRNAFHHQPIIGMRIILGIITRNNKIDYSNKWTVVLLLIIEIDKTIVLRIPVSNLSSPEDPPTITQAAVNPGGVIHNLPFKLASNRTRQPTTRIITVID